MERDESWVIAYRYPDMEAAGEAYQRARDIVFGEDIDASAFRVQINRVPHVVVVGDGPLDPDLRGRFEDACRDGEAAVLPAFARELLLSRRAEGRVPGLFWERRSQ